MSDEQVNTKVAPRVADDVKKILHPVTFSTVESRAMVAPVRMFDGGRPLDITADDETPLVITDLFGTLEPVTDMPRIAVEESFLKGNGEFILKEGHRDIPQGTTVVLFCEFDDGTDSPPEQTAQVGDCWLLVAQDIDTGRAMALGWKNAEQMADDLGWHDDDWRTQPVTVIQIKR